MRFLHNQSVGKITAIKLDDTMLPLVTETKFLGIWLDENLSWNVHLSKLITKLKKNIHLLLNHRNYLDTYMLKLIYLAQIQSHLNYCLVLWGSMASCENLNKIKMIQNKCMKMIQPNSMASQTYKELNLLDFTELIDLENKKLGYKISNKLLTTHMLEIIQCDPQNKTLIKKHGFLPKTKSSIYQQSFLYCGLHSLSRLPSELLSSPTIKSSVNKCKKRHNNKA